MAPRPKTYEAIYRILNSIEPDEYECHNWPRKDGVIGYYESGWIDGVGHVKMHRVALERKLGRPIETGKFALHTCDNKSCMNPDHLYEGTRKDNAQDRVLRNPESWDDKRTPEWREHMKAVQKLGTKQLKELMRDPNSHLRQKLKAWNESPEGREHHRNSAALARKRLAEIRRKHKAE